MKQYIRYFACFGIFLYHFTGITSLPEAVAVVPAAGEDGEAISWADSVLSTLTLEEKVGQLFMVEAYSNKNADHEQEVLSFIREQKVGGVIFFQGGPERQQRMNAGFQKNARVPLMIGIDGEWGISMRLDSTIRYPRQMTLGANGNDSMIYRMGRQVGKECKTMGIHVNFAPVVDINNNPKNPVINSRSFGEDKEAVARLSISYMKGMQDEGVMACAKHFPGHGNTDTDSHQELPVLDRSLDSLDATELYPFKQIFQSGVASVMVAHISLPRLIQGDKVPASLSPEMTDTLLQQKLGFKGLIFTDALNMKGVAANFAPGTIEVKAIQAGNDVLLFSGNVKLAIDSIIAAVADGRITQERINHSVTKILQAKYKYIVAAPTELKAADVKQGSLYENGEYLSSALYRDATTLLLNRKNTLPIEDYPRKGIASLVINDTLANPFQRMLLNYAPVSLFRCDREPESSLTDSLISSLSRYEYVILSIHNTSTQATSNYGISDKVNELILNLHDKVKLVVVMFGNAYTLTRLPDMNKSDAFVIAYEDTGWPQYFTAQAVFGAIPFSGNLPVSPYEGLKVGAGINKSETLDRLSFELPEEDGITRTQLSRVDSIIQHALDTSAMPGCRVLMAHKGKVIFNRSYGYHTYDKTIPVRETDLYDIASITKIAATGIALMKLVDDGKLDVEKKISRYLPELKHSNKKNLIIADILTHNAGLKAGISLVKDLLADGLPDTTILKDFPTTGYSTQVTSCYFIKDSYQEQIWNAVIESDVTQSGSYLYSDLGMIMMQKLIERVSGQTLYEYVENNFYHPLGLYRIERSPVVKFPIDQVVPTEYDSVLRCELLQGYVHDPVAALMGGMGGHAGIFCDANSLAVIMQMLLNEGTYGGRRYIDAKTVKKFTSKYYDGSFNRRGLVFDKPELIRTPDGPTGISASDRAFGHSGFTGTCAWADPEYDMVYIFLSNRVYPTARNNKLAKMNVRTDVMEQFYQLLQNK